MKKNNCLIVLFSTLALASLILVVIIDEFWKCENIWKTIITSALSALASLFGVAMIWEVIAKKTFAQEIIRTVGISENIAESGIVEIKEDFKNINWNEELRNATSFTTFFVYAKTWREANRTLLEKIGKNIEWKAVLANYNNDELMEYYDRKFSYGNYGDKSYSTKDLVLEAARELKKMNVQVFLSNHECMHSYYMISGNKCILALNKHYKEKGYVPTIKIEKNTINNNSSLMFEFCKKDLDEIIKESSIWEDK